MRLSTFVTLFEYGNGVGLVLVADWPRRSQGRVDPYLLFALFDLIA